MSQPNDPPYRAPYEQPPQQQYASYGPPGYAVVPPPVYPRLADGTPLSPWGPTASWGTRAIGFLWDVLYNWPAWVALLVAMVFMIAGSVLSADNTGGPDGAGGVLLVVGVLFYFVAAGLSLWRTITNLYLDQGRTGLTYGKRKVGIKLVRESDGQPCGGLMCFVRYLLSGVINNLFYLDFLWPLWDSKRQKLSDKVLGTIVIIDPAAAQRR